MTSAILLPAMALVLWSFVMWAWLYATRIPAIIRFKIPMPPTMTKNDLNAALPADVRWKADNYNHLMEQPTLFYAVAMAAAIAGAGEGVNAALAWSYVGLRIVHSLVQATTNVIKLRFAVFMLASLVLLALSVRVTMAVV
ncbi:MAG: MAPEG family protein [Alphaproteobacteria bacterium]|nr:MAPEG family protein [Alphaproteobacteria bacterium]